MTLKAALTAEEWKHAQAILKSGADPTIAAVVTAERVGVGDRHSLAALCLHEQEFGFTREDLTMLDHLSAVWCNEACGCNTEDEYFLLAISLADRIEALLPPEDAA